MGKINRRSAYVQLAFTFILTNLTAITSFATVWPSYALKVLESDDSPVGFRLSKYESNLVGSIPMLGTVLIIPAASFMCEAIGRKKSHVLTSLFFVVAWSLILTARTSIQILIGRFFIGLGSGLSFVSNFVFIAEITNLSVRGSAASMVGLMYNIGILVSYLQGWFFSYKVICYMSVTVSVAYTVVLCCLKDTPVYLLKNGEDAKALASLKFYRGESQTTEEILFEFSRMKSLGSNKKKSTDFEKFDSPEKEKLQAENDVAENAEIMNQLKLLFTVDHNRRALVSILTLMLLTTSMGMIAVQTYAGTFFSMAAPTISPHLCSVMLALVFVVSSGLTVVVTDMVSRRFLMISTCFVSSICLGGVGSLLRWGWGPVWMPPLAIALYCLAFPMGCMNVSFVQMSECFGPQVNSIATAIVLCSLSIVNFIVLFMFVPSVEHLGIDVTFFLFAGIGVVATVASVFFVKETRQVPLEKVQSMFAQGYLYRKCETL